MPNLMFNPLTPYFLPLNSNSSFIFRNQLSKRRRVHSLLLHMTIAHLVNVGRSSCYLKFQLVTCIYMPKEIIHNLTILWLAGDTVESLVKGMCLIEFSCVGCANSSMFSRLPCPQIF